MALELSNWVKSPSNNNKDEMSPKNASIKKIASIDTRERSYSLPAGDLARVKKGNRNLRIRSEGCENAIKSNDLVSSDNDLPELLQAFGVVQPQSGCHNWRTNRSHTIGPCDLGSMSPQERFKHRSEEILAELTSKSNAGSEECLAVLEAFGVLPSPPPEVTPRRRSHTMPSCDLKPLGTEKTKTSLSAFNLEDSARYSTGDLSHKHHLSPISDQTENTQ